MFGIVKQLKRIADALESQVGQQGRISSLWSISIEISRENLELSRMQARAYLRDVEARLQRTTPARDGNGKFAKKAPQTFTVILRDKGVDAIDTIKTVRKALNNSLKEAHTLVMGVPSVLAKNVSKEEVAVISQLFHGGATLEIKTGEEV
jgi:ribosomal protein L7/L12